MKTTRVTLDGCALVPKNTGLGSLTAYYDVFPKKVGLGTEGCPVDGRGCLKTAYLPL